MAQEDDGKISPFPGPRTLVVPVDSQTVPCPGCGELVDDDARRCSNCGVHFDGPAFQFAPREERTSRRHFRPWIALFIFVMLLALALAIFAPF